MSLGCKICAARPEYPSILLGGTGIKRYHRNKDPSLHRHSFSILNNLPVEGRTHNIVKMSHLYPVQPTHLSYTG